MTSLPDLPPPADLGGLDGLVIGLYLLLALGLGVVVARRARGSTENFFLSGRRLPWWLAGTSMVATAFASDTPLVVTGWTRAGGVAGNWRWWGYLFGAMLAVVVFARMWRRSAVFTDVDFMEFRYSGPSSRFLRVFKGLYQTVFLHCFVMGWVILAMTKVLGVLLDLGDEPLASLGPMDFTPAWLVMLGCVGIALIYSEVAGLWGVVLTDFVQFALAMAGSVILSIWVVDAFGGLDGLTTALAASGAADKVSAHPPLGSDPLLWSTEAWEFLVFAGVMWFANKNADGSGVMVQRILATKDERHSVLATLWYVVAQYAVRPWPWIIVALASLVLLPSLVASSPVDGTVRSVAPGAIVVAPAAGGDPVEIPVPDIGLSDWTATARVVPGEAVHAGQVLAATDDEDAYPVMMRRFLPAGLLGLLVASFLAAFMSTMDTHLNLASAYVVNDVYRRFMKPDEDERHYMRMARITGLCVMLLALVFAAFSSSVRGMFDAFSALYSGLGVVYVLRWFWWRINAWSEIAGLVTSGLGTLLLGLWPELATPLLPEALVPDGRPVFAGQLLLILPLTLAVVIPVTLLTPPVDAERLARFFDRVRPMGAWGPVAKPADWSSTGFLGWLRLLGGWIGGIVFLASCVFLPGNLLLERGSDTWPWVLAGGAGLAVLIWAMPVLRSRHVAGRP